MDTESLRTELAKLEVLCGIVQPKIIFWFFFQVNGSCSCVALMSLTTPFTLNVRRGGMTLVNSHEGWVVACASIFPTQKLGSKCLLPAHVSAVEQQGAWSKFIVRTELISFGWSQSWDVLSEIHVHFMLGAMGSIGWSMSKNPVRVDV